MVMAVPTPQCVGQEFVRQYYTLLNKDPNQLHRFYNKDSIFLHGRGPSEDGSPENPVLGQENIYIKIKDLNFIDCRAKIRQVDSHPTVNGSVVVQVSGELSNDAKPMRKFTQTFVLAPGDMPKKYYVHNDIFRYQDDVFPEENSDETAEGTVESEGEEETGHQLALNNGVGVHEQPTVDPVLTPQEPPATPVYYGEQINEQRSTLMNQGVFPDDEENQELQEVVIDKPQPEVHHIEAVVPQAPEPAIEDLVTDDITGPLNDVSASPKEVELTVEPQEPQMDIQAEMAQDVVEDVEEKPRTWAALASKNAAVKLSTRPPVKHQVAQPPTQTVAAPVPSSPRPQQPSSSRTLKESRGLFGTREARMNARNAPDNHQVFIGNLPSGVSNADVHAVFGKFGNVLEIRLNPKNFGFVIFDSAEPVEQVLAERPIKIGNHEINIEEKKPSGSVGRGGGAGNRRGDSSGGMGMRAGGRGGSRGGQGGARGGSFGSGGRGGNAGPGSGGRGGRRGSGGRGGGGGAAGGGGSGGGGGGKFKQ